MKGKKERIGRGRGEKEHVGPISLHFSMFIIARRGRKIWSVFIGAGEEDCCAGYGCGSQARIWCKISRPSQGIGLEQVYIASFPHAGGRKHHT